MTCRHCQQPIQRCGTFARIGYCPVQDCKEWVHARNHQHVCAGWKSAEPEPGAKPSREVA